MAGEEPRHSRRQGEVGGDFAGVKRMMMVVGSTFRLSAMMVSQAVNTPSPACHRCPQIPFHCLLVRYQVFYCLIPDYLCVPSQITQQPSSMPGYLTVEGPTPT
ncbi:hypothetical protein VPH35_122463 [Triticum aestivum]